MRKIIIILAISIGIPFAGFSQYYWDYGARAGVANSLTDIGGMEKTARPWILDMKMQETRWNFGGYVRYKFHEPFSLDADVDYIRLQGADSLSTNPGRRGRNCNFKNDIVMLTVKGIWAFYENPDLGNTYRYQNSFSAYAFLGLSLFWTHPQGWGNPVDSAGKPLAGPDSYHGLGWYDLHSLKTEDVTYHEIQLGIPVGVGFNFTLSKTYRIGWELAWTETFTNYLDDVGRYYPTAAQAATMSPQALYFSDRYNQIPLAEQANLPESNNYGNGQLRGKSGHDSFLTATVTFGYVIRGRSNFYRSHYGSLFSKGKYRMRRRRAKF
jgi:hypothetical protein